MIEALQSAIMQLVGGSVLMYIIVGGIFALIIGVFAIDRNGSTWIVVALPFFGALVAPIVAFVVSTLTGSVFSFSIPGLVLPMIVVAVISVMLCYGFSLDIEAPVSV